MKSVIYLLIVSGVLSACKPKSSPTQAYLNREGVWRIVEEQDKHTYELGYAYIMDNSFWRFDTRTFPSLVDSGLVLRNDSIFDNGSLKYLLNTYDSTSMLLKSLDGLEYLLSNQRMMHSLVTTKEELKDNLSRMLKGDSVARKIVGSWELQKASSTPFELPESSEYYRDFTVSFNPNREAVFYTDHKQDSTVTYMWEPTLSGVSLAIGCIGGIACSIELTSDSTITMFERKSYHSDTTFFYLKRVNALFNRLH